MCGFLGEFCFNSEMLSHASSFDKLLELSKHRGPDSTQVHTGENYRLGFNRLAILDLSPKGNQPKTSPSGRYHIVFNGEIYNYLELAERYKLQNLNSTSDTEVIICLLDILGVEQTLTHLNGMFAITIIDKQTNSCYLSRDFAGIKPLFYGVHANGIVAASQFDQIFKHEWFKHELQLRPEIVKEYFGFGYMQAPNTIYENIYQVNPGEVVIISNTGQYSKNIILQFDKTHKHIPKPEPSNYGNVLKDAIKRQLISDVSVATFLSGGIDSPLISSYAKKSKTDIEAFTLKVNDKRLNESEIAQSYAKAIGLSQHIVSIEANDLIQSLDDHFNAYSEPFGDYSSIPTYVIARESKKRHTVMLSGDGGDELFLGYPRMLDVLDKRFWFKMPYILRKSLAKITNKLGITNTWAPYFNTIDTFILNKHIKIPFHILDKVQPNCDFSEAIHQLYQFDNSSREGLLHEMRWNEFYAHMQRVLIKVDRASMAHSLEVRIPYLDKESIVHAWKELQDLKTYKDLKITLKTLLSEEVPNDLINKKKRGFLVPLSDWLRGDIKQDLIKTVFDVPFYGANILETDVLKQYVQDFIDAKHDNSWGVWHIYSWQKWAAIHVNN
ncbi:asparagine synthase (glutamine-hydrolyzing) [Psychroserpens sp. SPM9]|uniref:asparagine synthase (glutamine-hydrolyzing) n=1 Tax=Psychroserpens sp. SPM9 TaxID=2975598 RepID=UPI0021A2622D|nr:asparagine synthase (glutamine-hydrolyzing) [Psychroserpens sp. SPM9]MDG5492242.1 asparagine synthase (glutamine-hydrolyzing) [Psychroserpens sp. SPM9]